MLQLGTIVLGVDDTARGVAFWSAALGYEVVAFEGADDGFTILRPVSGEGTRLAIHRSMTPSHDRPRVHIDLIVADAEEQASEVERLLALGATRVSWEYPESPDFVVLSDPDGNRFCIVDTGHG